MFNIHIQYGSDGQGVHIRDEGLFEPVKETSVRLLLKYCELLVPQETRPKKLQYDNKSKNSFLFINFFLKLNVSIGSTAVLHLHFEMLELYSWLRIIFALKKKYWSFQELLW